MFLKISVLETNKAYIHHIQISFPGIVLEAALPMVKAAWPVVGGYRRGEN
jgi:hypothetical protein